MPATRRKLIATAPPTPPALAPSPATAMHSSLLPTPLEAALLAIYPVTLLLGSLSSRLSPLNYPPHTAAVYSVDHQSFQPPELAPSYFATKSNIFNVYFVKKGWAWISAALLLFSFLGAQGRHALAQGAHTDAADARLRRRYQALLRWGLGTLAWVCVTQWFFGPALTDRVFLWTGGACVRALEKEAALAAAGDAAGELLAGIASSAACRVAGGRMMGGYDVSGHVFLLVLGSGMVLFEVAPVVWSTVRGLTGRRVVRTASGVQRPLEEVPEEGEVYRAGAYAELHGTGGPASRLRSREEHTPAAQGAWTTLETWTAAFAGSVGLLSWWMLLMTASFFHTWSEKAIALVIALTTLWGIYIAPRTLPGVRDVLGLPGV